MGKLVQLEVNNFKSYRGHHVLLFGDAYFTSIIGPNGSGKSNSMDAISFVLGMKASALRSGKLEHLVYRGRKIQSATINADGTATAADGDANGDSQENGTQASKQRGDPTSAWVMAIFEDDAGQTHRWKRIITGAGQSEYKIDGRAVTQKAYNEALEEQSILVKARNFLVFQGDVESVASQNPKDLTRLIEQISGSLDHKDLYDTLKVAADHALENQTEQLQMRRQINKEVDAYQTEKAAADKYEGWISQRDEAIITQVLWKLFHFQQTIQASSNEIAKHQEELKEHKRGVAKYEQKSEEARQAQAKATRHVNKTEREIRAKEKEIEDGENKLVPIDEKIKISTKDLQKFQTRIATLAKERDNEQQQVGRFKKDLATVDKAQQKWEDETRAALQKEGRELSDQDLQEYNLLRSEVNKQTHADQVKITQLKRTVQTDQGTVTNLKQKVQGIEAQIEKLEGEITNLQDKQQELKDQTKSTTKDRKDKEDEYNKLESDRRKTERQATEWNQNLQEALTKLQDAERDAHQSRRERQFSESVMQLKNINNGKGVHGRYRDLCRAKQKKYEAAMMTLLGWQLDAIIVDTQKIAQDCINYSKEMRLGQFNFIPLDTITIKAVNPALKGIHKGARLGIDCIEYEPHLERAMASACGDTLICDDIDVAKKLRWEKGVQAKCVTLNGTVIGKGGTMTGGRTSDKPNRAWNDKDIDEYRRAVDGWRKQLASLPKIDGRNDDMDNLRDEIAELDDQIGSARNEIQALEMNIQSKRKELNYQKKELKDYRPNYQKEAGALQNHEDELRQYQDAVNAVADGVYATFCQRLGFASIREYEDQQGTVQQEASKRRLDFTVQRSRLQNQIKFHENQLSDLNNRIEELEAKAEYNETQIKEFEEEKEGLQNDIDTLNAELEQLQEKLTEVGLALEHRKKVATEAKREVDKRNVAVKDVLNAVDKLEAEIKRTASNRFALLRKCKVDEIKLPLAEGSAPLASLPIGEAGPDPDAMDVDEDPTQINQPEVDDYGIEVDFDQLEEELQEDASEAKASELEDIIAKLTRDIDSAQVNLRAGTRLDATKDKLSSIEKNFDAARKAAAKAKKDFEDIKRKRHDLFMKAFDHISENIGGTYKDLTKSATFPLGGQAYLDMEDSEEPYLAGLKYHAMPPLKRFRDMEHLSGGEKTIAALALLFAIHSYQPSPFFVLDEVDAALDNVNIGRVAKYVREHAGPGMQFIVISLKSGLFQESEGLVGVMRDQSRMTSKVVSLDLRKYQPT